MTRTTVPTPMRIWRATLSIESPVPRSRTTSSRLKIRRGRPIGFPVLVPCVDGIQIAVRNPVKHSVGEFMGEKFEHLKSLLRNTSTALTAVRDGPRRLQLRPGPIDRRLFQFKEVTEEYREG